jgi:aryl-alcohol dehydrogenase-like predicted oxidoreductase
MTGQIKSPDDLDADDMRKWLPRFSAENFPKNLKLVGQFEEVGKRKGCTSGQVALAWVLGQGVDIIPIPGTKKIKYLEENVAALDVKLTDEELKELRGYVDDAEVHGGRYPDSLMDGLIWDSVPL